MVAVLSDHLLRIPHGLPFPRVAADVLPARDLGEHEQPQFVAAVDKMAALRIVARAHGVAAQFVFQDVGVKPLRSRRGRVSEIRPALMPVQSAQPHLLTVEVKSVGAEFRRPETDAHRLRVHRAAAVRQAEFQPVQLRRLAAPAADILHIQLRFRVRSEEHTSELQSRI